MIVPRLPTDLNSLLLFVFIYILLSTCLVFIINYYDNRTGSNYNNNNNVDEENTKDYQRRRINRDCRILGSCSRPSKTRFCCEICCNYSKYRCSRCRQVRYCSETCQIKHWRSGHRIECNEFKSVGVSKPSSSSGRRPPDTVHEHTNKQNENSNGGIQPTKKISNKEVENVKECLICLSIIHTSKTSRPSVTCHTCKQTFHLDCLSKWYSVSKGSNCPQCRSPLQIR